MSDKTEDSIRKFFERKLKESGYLLENKVEAKLQANFNVKRDVSYLDKDTSKERRNDFLAITFIPDDARPPKGKKKAVVSLNLVIECKSLSDHGWIFFPGKNEKIVFLDNVCAMKLSENSDPLYKTIPLLSFPKLFHAASYAEYFLDNSKSQDQPRSNQRDSNLYESIHTVTKATRHRLDWTKKAMDAVYMRYNDLEIVPIVTVFQPLIIFYGRMYASEIIKDEIRLTNLKYAQIPKIYTSESYNEDQGNIHIVHFDALDEYLTLLHDYYWVQSPYISKNQDKLLDLTYQNAVSWRRFGST
jgi:hypothetical protein